MSRITTTLSEIRQLDLAHEQTISPDYLDENQHVNVQYYVHLVERGLGTIFDRVGLGAVYASALEFGNFALEQHIRYFAEILVDERISVFIRMIELTPKRAYFIGFLVNETRAHLAATVEVVMMNIDMKQRRGTPFPPAPKAKLEALLAAHQALPWEAPVCGVMRA